MDDGRGTSVQTDMFLILTYNSFEHYLLNIHQSILHIISKILQSFSDELYSVTVNQFNHVPNIRIVYPKFI